MILRYDIAVTGAAQVERALAGIERRMVAHNRTVSRITGQRGLARAATAKPKAASVDASLQREIKQQEAYWRRAHQRAADHRIREDNRAALNALRNEQKLATAR